MTMFVLARGAPSDAGLPIRACGASSASLGASGSVGSPALAIGPSPTASPPSDWPVSPG